MVMVIGLPVRRTGTVLAVFAALFVLDATGLQKLLCTMEGGRKPITGNQRPNKWKFKHPKNLIN